MELQQVAEQVAAEVVLQLVVDGHIVVAPASVPAVERRVAMILREVLLQKDERRRFQLLVRQRGELDLRATLTFKKLFGRVPAPPRPFLSVVEDIVQAIRSSPEVERVLADDDTLVRRILNVIARHRAPGQRAGPFGGSGSPPPSSGPEGCPAEVRAWEVPRGETPPEPDPERRERGEKRGTRALMKFPRSSVDVR